MMTSMMSDPRMMEQMLGSDPRARGADANPELRSRLTDPEFSQLGCRTPTFARWCRCSARWRSYNRAGSAEGWGWGWVPVPVPGWIRSRR